MSEDTKMAAVKQFTAWGGVGVSKWLTAIGITSWGDFSALCASVVSILFIADWIWKKFRARGKDQP